MIMGSRVKNLKGIVVGNITVLSFSGLDIRGQSLWDCLCNCGETSVMRGSSLRHPKNSYTSCIKCRDKNVGVRSITHGMSNTPTHKSWDSMLGRCLRPTDDHYQAYGAKGIIVCDRWLKFENFYEDMGERPKGKTLDRYPNNQGNYEPGNCRWANAKEQNNNRRVCRFVTYMGETMTVTQWADKLGFSHNTLRNRFYRGKFPPVEK